MTERSEIERVIFTDPGIDDAAALLHLSNLRDTRNSAVVASYGNVSEEQSYRNLITLRDVFSFQQKWKLFRGPEYCLDTEYRHHSQAAVYKGNGKDGLWGMQTRLRTKFLPYSERMDFFDAKTVKEIISLAPLTGPLLLHRNGAKPASTLIMGGAFLEGNVKPINPDGSSTEGLPRVAEWNFFKDALSAKEYFEKHASLNVWVVTMDACMSALISADTILGTKTRRGADYNFMKKILSSWATEYAKINPEAVKRGIMLSDLVAVISYKHPEIAHWEKTGLRIEDKVGHNLGRSYRSRTNPKCNVATRIKEEQLGNLFEAINQTVFGG